MKFFEFFSMRHDLSLKKQFKILILNYVTYNEIIFRFQSIENIVLIICFGNEQLSKLICMVFCRAAFKGNFKVQLSRTQLKKEYKLS